MAVTLLDFDVIPVDATTLRVAWSTASELNVYGFHLWRSQNEDRSQAVPITAKVIEAQGDLLFDADYLFIDTLLQPETQSTYWLQEIDTSSGNVQSVEETPSGGDAGIPASPPEKVSLL
jgi:hypothetical protein